MRSRTCRFGDDVTPHTEIRLWGPSLGQVALGWSFERHPGEWQLMVYLGPFGVSVWRLRKRPRPVPQVVVFDE